MKIYNEIFCYQVLITTNEIQKMINSDNSDDIDKHIESMKVWCTKTFGDDNYDYLFVDEINNLTDTSDIFKFKSDNHRMMFMMKWAK